MLKYIYFIVVSTCLVQAKHEQYIGHSLYEVQVNTYDQARMVVELVERLYLDIWNYPSPENEGYILVAPEKKLAFEDSLIAINATYRVETGNITDPFKCQQSVMIVLGLNRNTSLKDSISPRYKKASVLIESVDRHLVDVANRFPRVARVVSGGRSVENRDIKYLKISSDNFNSRTKPIVFISCLLHPREWVVLPVCLWAIQELVINNRERDLIQDIDWIVLPIANPDGYEWSHTNARFWRKNRRQGHHATCVGVDPNRNYNFHWGTASSRDPCSDTFHGPRAFSEPESWVIANIINTYRSRMSLYLDIHSFGSMILFGFAAPNRGNLAPNHATLNQVGTQQARAIDAVKWRQHRNYRVGNIAAILGVASGGGTDWAQALLRDRLSYAYELPAYRGRGGTLNGFLVEPEFIRQAGFETWEGIKVAARFVVRNRGW